MGKQSWPAHTLLQADERQFERRIDCEIDYFNQIAAMQSRADPQPINSNKRNASHGPLPVVLVVLAEELDQVALLSCGDNVSTRPATKANDIKLTLDSGVEKVPQEREECHQADLVAH